MTDRRSFFKRAANIVFGSLLGLVPLVAGLGTLLDPLRRRAQQGGAVRVAPLSALPDDGVPRKFPVIASRRDAWNQSPATPIGAVYLRRLGQNQVEAFNVACPHAGCFVEYQAEGKFYSCPCHNSSFALNGKVNGRSPSPRGLDALKAEVRDGEIWVTFQNFRAGIAERIPET